MNNILGIGIYVAVALVAIVVIGVIFSSLYKRASKERAFVRTGFGGQLVVINGGAVILPVLHGTVEVNMKTEKLEVRRVNELALITKDRMRVDATVDFYVRVKPEIESIASAAQTLGEKTLNPAELKELIEGKFVDALRSVAAEMDMEELHEKRSVFVQNVQKAVSEDLLKNGLELETVSLTGLDQTSRDYFNPHNVFDAEGLTKMTRAIEDRRKIRNDIEQETQVEIARKNLDAETRQFEIKRDMEYARLNNAREIAIRQEEQSTEIETAKAQRQFETEKARAEARRQTREAEIAADQAIEIAAQASKIAVAKKSEETSQADAAANAARAEAVRSEEKVVTARETEAAERVKSIQIIEAQQEAETKSIGIVIQSQAEKEAAQNRAEAMLTLAKGEAEADKTRAEGLAETYRVEAGGKRSLNEAANVLSPAQVALAERLALIQALPSIIEQSVKPMENIDGIKILHVDGINGSSSGGGSVAGGAPNGNFADAAAAAALRYRSQAPMVDALLSELGIRGGTLDGLVQAVVPSAGTENAGVGSVAEGKDTSPEAGSDPVRVPPVPADSELAAPDGTEHVVR